MDRITAEKLLNEAKELNNGAWVKHSCNVACLAEKIAERMELDSEKAYILGLLHDIGRRNGNMEARHVLEGYRFLKDMGFEEGARICMTHTFQYKDVEGIYDAWDCSSDEKKFIADYLGEIIYDDYDKLIQLCDALSLENGYCYAEKKMVSSVIKFGFKDTTINKWKAILELKEYFDDKINGNIYEIFS